jgi:hypothetical protein
MLGPLDWWSRELERLGAAVRLQQRIDDPQTLDSDAVIWATGARPGNSAIWRNRPQLVEGIPGTAHCPHGREILSGHRSVAGKVLVIDEEGGWPAVSLAESLAAHADVESITVTTDRLALGLPALQYSVEAGVAMRRLQAAGVVVIPGTLIADFANSIATTIDGQPLGPFDAVVLSTGPEANPIPHGVQAIGDCVAPRSIWAAVTEGMELARSL